MESSATVFISAIKNNDISTIKRLIKGGANVNVSNEFGQTPLHMAAFLYAAHQQSGRELLELLIKCGADVNAKDKDNRTPLYYAVCRLEYNDSDHALLSSCLRSLLDAGADPNICAETSNSSPLSVICSYKGFNQDVPLCIELTKQLINAGADVKQQNLNEETLLHIMTSDNAELSRLLLEAGTDVNAKDDHGRTPLIKFCDVGFTDTAAACINFGAEVNAIANNGDTPLIALLKSNKCHDPISLLDILIGKGADVNAKNNSEQTPMSFACKIKNKSCVQIIEKLANAGADVNFKNAINCVPLHIAAFNHNMPAIVTLLKMGANPNVKNNYNCFPIDYLPNEKMKKQYLEESCRFRKKIIDEADKQSSDSSNFEWEY